MRCITAEERELLVEAATSARAARDASDRERSVLQALVATGNMVRRRTARWVNLCTITPRGRLALACHAAVNARLV